VHRDPGCSGYFLKEKPVNTPGAAGTTTQRTVP